MVPMPSIPIDSIRQPNVNDFRSPILSANNPHEIEPAINKNPYIANTVPASALEIFSDLVTSTKIRGKMKELVVETNRALTPPVEQIQP